VQLIGCILKVVRLKSVIQGAILSINADGGKPCPIFLSLRNVTPEVTNELRRDDILEIEGELTYYVKLDLRKRRCDTNQQTPSSFLVSGEGNF
jgi:hypothetical protein